MPFFGMLDPLLWGDLNYGAILDFSGEEREREVVPNRLLESIPYPDNFPEVVHVPNFIPKPLPPLPEPQVVPENEVCVPVRSRNMKISGKWGKWGNDPKKVEIYNFDNKRFKRWKEENSESPELVAKMTEERTFARSCCSARLSRKKQDQNLELVNKQNRVLIKENERFRKENLLIREELESLKAETN